MDKQSAKVNAITAINELLLKYHREPLNPNDFDILYDLSLEELYHAQIDVTKHLQMLSFSDV